MTEYEGVRPPFRINFRVSADMNDWLDKRAYEMGIPKSAIIAFALEEYRKQYETVDAMPGLLQAWREGLEKEGK